ncbi:uncharacterized protein LOC133914770 isoform X2 [Phragmites australis]|uniref:uncharacterized protein LOC133914770 isoform X2 n=1 Tax=Phragmites australis TaxID=29695 RepID=UPI002D78286D|nr:uncharacterized protein LOC133914770 isoform X2 [Phragmites australis]
MEGLEGGESRGAGLRLPLQFDPGKEGFDRTLFGVSLSALFSRLLGWSKNEQERTESAAAAVSIGITSAVAVFLAALYAYDERPRRARPRRLSASALAGRNSARSCALPAPDDGLRILSAKDEYLENVIHGALIGSGDDEPVLVARVETTQTEMSGANAVDETEDGQSEEERQELERLRELWLSLLEREQRLELRLQELDGHREQEATVRELENRVAAAAMETRLLELNVSSLQEENGRLRAQVAELDAARAELARAKEKLRAIKARMQGEKEEARSEAAALRARVAELENGREERASALAAEAAGLRKVNAALEEESMELALRLQDAEQAASSVNLVLEESMDEEANYLRETNERLVRQIEQLRSDHCAHVEELVYLKWVNACLRHEVRDQGLHPPSSAHQEHDADGSAGAGGMSAMDLSKSMSFRSSERAKQLMLRYGHPGLEGFDPAILSPLHETIDGDGDERTRAHKYEPEKSPSSSVTTTKAASAAPAPGKKAGPRKLKFLGNIKKLLPGGSRSQSRNGRDHGGRESMKAPGAEYLEKATQWLSTHDVLDGDHSYESTPLSSCERTPLSSVTTVTTRGGGGCSERGATQAEAEPATLARSKSDSGSSYGREASRNHALRLDHPTEFRVGPDGLRASEKREPRRRSEELRMPEAAYVRTGDMHAE